MAGTRRVERVALLPWGDRFEDYLDAIGQTFETFRTTMDGGWLFGYVRALRSAGIESVLVVVTSSVRRAERVVHEPTGAVVWALPPVRAHTVARRRGGAVADELAPYLATPLRPLAHLMRAERIDALVVQEYEYPRFDALVALGKVVRRPVFATFQGGQVALGRVERWVRPWSVRRCAGLVVGPAAEVERVQARYGVGGEQVARVFNPIDASAWDRLDRGEARSALGLSIDARVAAWHGRVEMRHKGLDVLVDAWAEVEAAAEGTDVRLVMLGTGSDAAALRARVAERDLRGLWWADEFTLDRARVRQLLAAADVYAFPSRHEGFPVAPIEAMAAALPVVAAAAPGVEDIFGEGEAAGGVVVPVGDVGGFASGLLRVLRDPALATELGRRGRARVEAAFSLETVGAELAAFLNRP